MKTSSARAIALVAMREIITRVTSKAFVWTTAIIVLAIVGGGIVLSATLPTGLPPRSLGVTDQTVTLTPALEGAATAAGIGLDVEQVTTESEGEERVRDGSLDALLTGEPGSLVLAVERELDPALDVVVSLLTQQEALTAEIVALGGDPADVTSAVAAARPEVRAIGDASDVDEGQLFTGMLSGVLIFIAITMAGQLVAQGVVEEKTSRVVELLLATIRPWELMAGKVAGIGAIGLLQLVLVTGAGSAVAMSTGTLDQTGVNLGATVGWVLVWFLLGYVMYASVLAAAGALVSRQEEVQTVVFPILMIMMIPYVLGVSVATTDPTSPLITNLSLIPLFSPFLMPIRIAQGTAEAWEVALAVGLSVAIVPLLVWLAGRIYANAVMRTGARVPLREAFRRG